MFLNIKRGVGIKIANKMIMKLQFYLCILKNYKNYCYYLNYAKST